METKANYFMVGVFSLFFLCLGFLCIYWITSSNHLEDFEILRFRIPGSASGLSKGSTVSFNGVKVGEVQSVYIDVLNPSIAIADAKIQKNTPLSKSTYASIGIANLAGSANIELKGGNLKEKNLFHEAKKEKRVAEMFADPSPVTNLLANAQDIFGKAKKIITNLEELTYDIRKPLTVTANAAEKFSQSLVNNFDNIDKFLINFNHLSSKIYHLGEKIDTTIKIAEKILGAIDEKKINTILGNFEIFTKNVTNDSKKMSLVLSKIDLGVDSAYNLIGKTEITVDKINTLFASFDPKILTESVLNFKKVVDTSNRVAENIDSVSSMVRSRVDDIDHIIKDSRAFSKKIASISERTDKILIKMEKMLQTSDSKGLIQEIHATVEAYREIAKVLNEKIIKISSGIEGFSDKGLRNVENFMNETHRSIAKIERAITNFEKNPQRILTDDIKETPRYRGKGK